MASTEGVNIVISGDSSQAVKAVDDVTKAVDNVKGNSIKITADTSQAQGEVNKLANATESVNDAHAEITADSSQAVDAVNKASEAMENINDAHAKITADGSQAHDEINKVADAEEGIKDAHSDITADGSQAFDELKRLEKLIFGIDGKKVEFQVRGVIRDEQGRLHNLKGQFLKAGNEAGEAFASGTETGIKRVEQSLRNILSFNVGGQISSFFSSIFDGVISAGKKTADVLSGVMRNALSIGGGFEAQITNVKVISGATEQELDMLIKKAREMGATLPITAKDAATAMQLLAQRGTSAKDILSSVAEVANLTISQGIDMGSAADLLGSTMTNFNISVNDASKITAIFNNACNQSALSMTKLIEAMRYVGPAAGAVDMGLTEAVSAMEAIANAGLTGEMTGTGLAMVLSKLAATSHVLGVNTKNLDGSMRPLKDIFTELNDKGFSLADAIETFGQRGSKAALALAKNSKTLAENEERLKNWGSTQAAVNEKSKTFTNTLAALQSAVEELHIEIFEQIKDQSKEAVGGVAELTRTFSKWVGETQIAGKSLNSFIEGLGFKIPSGTGFKELLNQFDVQAFTDRIKGFGSTLKGIGESIANFFNSIKTPLSWLIEHLDTFATISFWGWILGKGLQVPAAIMGIVSAFKELHTVGKSLLALSWAKLVPLLTTPIGLLGTAVAAGAGVVLYANSQINAANEELKKAVKEEKKYLAEQAEADLSLPVDIQLNFKTGFEKLPESYIKASDKIRSETDATVKEIQENFKVKFAAALDYISRKFPDLADNIENIGNISNSTFRQISQALYGDEAAFEALPEHLRKITEHINAVDSGLANFGVDLYGISTKYRDFQLEVEKPIKKDETVTFFEDLAASVKNVTTSFNSEIERSQKFLQGANGQLVVQISLTQAQKKLNDFVKSISDKYAIPEDIVQAGLFERLSKLAQAGDSTAQSLINGWNNAGASLDTFLANAQDTINYLSVSPEKFMPALNSMMKGIQRIDPLTGKVTEQFKKAHDALKQWGNVTFDQLSNRIQKLRRAVEGGFIDQSALEAEFRRVMPQLKLQVVNDLQPQREQYRSDRDFQAVVASELISRIYDLFGEIGMDMARSTFPRTTGSEMGRAIIAEVERGLSNTSGTFKIDGVEQFTQGLGSIANFPQNISNAISPFVSQLEQLHISQNNPSLPVARDYSSVIASVVREIQASSQANVNAVNGVTSAVNAVENAVKSQQTDSSQTNISQVLTNAFAPFVSRIEQSGNQFQSSSATMAKNIQDLDGSIHTLKNSADANISAINQLQASLKATGDSATNTVSIAPLTGAVQNLASALNVIQNIQQANSSALSEVINAVRSVETALRSINAGNNYDIDINQQGFLIEKKSDADMLARSTVNALRSGIGNGGI